MRISFKKTVHVTCTDEFINGMLEGATSIEVSEEDWKKIKYCPFCGKEIIR